MLVLKLIGKTFQQTETCKRKNTNLTVVITSEVDADMDLVIIDTVDLGIQIVTILLLGEIETGHKLKVITVLMMISMMVKKKVEMELGLMESGARMIKKPEEVTKKRTQ